MIDLKDLGLTPEVEAEINKRVEQSEKGLKENRDKILAQNVKLKDVLGAADDDDLAKKLADEMSDKEKLINDLKGEVLTLKGDKDGLAEHNRTAELQYQERERNIKERFETRIKESSQSAYLEKILGRVHSSKQRFARADLMSMAETTIDEEGNATTILRDGDKVYKSTDEFFAFAEQDEAWAGMFKQPPTQGAGVQGNNGGGNGQATTTRQTSERTNSYLATMKV